ncbi:ACP S-malonyltransferase [Nitratiruptor tergarcus]|uniref:Malonyl CoA-acyl carrier protein transacylase n=1 Tax=Nitratiruptor tergarcus DSM 16512 TaxID=1069081 RepID=A0A1W1WUR9_9BACT|nr:ACP S-malonyltransferase [Nitratiruptor tergarcus]SMC09929.1 [acyl-carrier-protein] S-malonyltransferase [Nitratiruptor tergarcus DSM 16512]
MPYITFLFPGQGSQKIGMGKDFFENSSLAKELFEAASDRLKIDFTKLLFEENDRINETAYTQPAIMLVSLTALKLFQSHSNITPQYALGHSLGEFGAVASVGALGSIDAIELVHYRGKFMSEAAKDANGGMMVVMGLSDEEVEQICAKARDEGKKVWPANYNSDGQIVVAGLKADLMSLEGVFKDAGAKRALLLNMSVASHCPLMEPARKPLQEYLEQFLQDSFAAPVISNVTAAPYKTKNEAIELLSRQLVEPVHYKQSIQNIENETDIFIEFGEGNVLKGLNRRITKKPTICISNMKSLEDALEVINK